MATQALRSSYMTHAEAIVTAEAIAGLPDLSKRGQID
jgi:hypothetical protein